MQIDVQNEIEIDTTVTLVCCAIIDETPQAKTYVFRSEDENPIAFLPGQFMNFTFMIDGLQETRCYSLSSSAARGSRVSITVKKVENGLVSNWLFDRFRVGDRVIAEGPLGNFTPDFNTPLLLLSAGSGMTPMASMMRTAADLALDTDVTLVHFARSPDEMLFRDELSSWARLLPRARIIPVATQPKPGSGWVGPHGRLNAALLAALVPDLRQRNSYICGPTAFMDMAKAMLLDHGVPTTAIHEESFVTFNPDEELAANLPAEIAFELEFARSRQTVQCGREMTVLAAAKAAKIPLQTSCGKGICGTCRVKLCAGTVEMKHNGGIKEREIDQGWILACCSKPTSNLRIDR